MTDATIDLILGGLLIAALLLVAFMPGLIPERFRYFSALARQAGFDPAHLRPLFWASKMLLAVLLPLLFAELLRSTPPPLVILIVGAAGYLLPDLWLLAQRRTRRLRIQQGLSFFLDLLVSLLRSGLDLDESFRRAGSRGFPPAHPLAEEVRIVSEEIAAGKERSEAFGALATRTSLPELHAVAAALELGSRLGFPLAEILTGQADLQRERRSERGKRRIDRAMVVALFPVLLCGFPLFIVIVVLPMLLELMRTLDLMRVLFGAN